MIVPLGKAFCDTSFFFASLHADDAHFDRAGVMLEHCFKNTITLYTTHDVVSETVTLLRYRASYQTALQFLDVVKPTLAVVSYDNSVRTAAEEVFKKLAKDKKLSYCDAISYIVITQLLENIPCFTFDRDFRSLGLTVYP